MNDHDLLKHLDILRSTMIAVATGGPRIDDANEMFQRTYREVEQEFIHRQMENPLPYKNLWDWYGRWSSGDMPTYQSRRTYVSELFAPLVHCIATHSGVDFAPTGWVRVDRTVDELRRRLAAAQNEEQYQAVALLCREALISVAQAVYVPELHPSLDGVIPSESDAKRQLEAYLATEIQGGSNSEARKHAKSALELSVALQHRRTASFRDAALAAEATTAVVNIIAIISGRRDPVASA